MDRASLDGGLLDVVAVLTDWLPLVAVAVPLPPHPLPSKVRSIEMQDERRARLVRTKLSHSSQSFLSQKQEQSYNILWSRFPFRVVPAQ